MQIVRKGVKVLFELLGSLTNVNQGQEIAAAPKNRKQPKPSNHLKIAWRINETGIFSVATIDQHRQ
jgi:hypothetical protein